MNRLFELLRERPWTWGIPLALLVVNLMVLSTYRAIYAGRVSSLESELEEQRADLAQVERTKDQVQARVQQASDARDGIRQLYESTFATEEERFTDLIRGVRELAVKAGLRPDTISYPQQEIEDFGLYERSINFLELSEQFVVLRSLGLSSSSNQQQVRITLSLTSLFSGRDETDGEMSS